MLFLLCNMSLYWKKWSVKCNGRWITWQCYRQWHRFKAQWPFVCSLTCWHCLIPPLTFSSPFLLKLRCCMSYKSRMNCIALSQTLRVNFKLILIFKNSFSALTIIMMARLKHIVHERKRKFFQDAYLHFIMLLHPYLMAWK